MAIAILDIEFTTEFQSRTVCCISRTEQHLTKAYYIIILVPLIIICVLSGAGDGGSGLGGRLVVKNNITGIWITLHFIAMGFTSQRNSYRTDHHLKYKGSTNKGISV